MASTTITVGEQVYDYTVDVVKVIEFCSNMTDILAGNAPVPLEGARRDIFFEGTVNGPKMRGTIAGVDYMNIRADGRRELHIHASITTDDGRQSLLRPTASAPRGGRRGNPRCSRTSS